jgi:hypothetical protein
VDGQHGVGRAGVPDVPLDNPLAHRVIAPVCPKLFELVVEVEHERRGLKAARLSAGVRVQADDEKAFAAKAERKVRVVRVRPDPLIIIGLTACSALQSNNYAFKPIHYEIS